MNYWSLRDSLAQVGRFMLVGGSGVVVDFSCYWALTRGFSWWQEHFVLASSVAAIIAASNNFYWNRRWTFRSQEQSWLRQYGGYLLVTGLNILLVQVGLWLAVRFLGWYDLLAKIIILALVTTLYFLVLRQLVFRPAAVSAEV